jgi:hypothetical protein
MDLHVDVQKLGLVIRFRLTLAAVTKGTTIVIDVVWAQGISQLYNFAAPDFNRATFTGVCACRGKRHVCVL